MHQFAGLELPASADFHVHLRDADMMEAVNPTIRQGGVDIVYVCGGCVWCVSWCCVVMPNLVPPITTVKQALSYQKRLQALASDGHVPHVSLPPPFNHSINYR